MRSKYNIFSISSCLIFFASTSIAQTHKGINFQGVIKNPTGEFVTRSGLTVKGMIFSPNNCVLRVEEFSNVSINNGYINLVIGKGTPVSGQDPGLSFEKVMDNTQVIPNLTCYDLSGNTVTSSYDPADSSAGDKRRKFRLIVTLDSVPVVADFNMRAVAYAMNAETADEAKKLNGKLASDFIQATGGVTQQKAQDWFSSSVMTSILGNNYKSSSAASADTLSATLPISKGGTGGIDADQARTNLGLGPLSIKPLGDANKVLYGDGRWDSLPVGSGGTVSSIGAGTGLKTDKAGNAAITNSGELSVDVGTAAGQVVQVQSGGKLPALDGSSLTNISASLAGDVTGTSGASKVEKIQNRAVVATAPNNGEVLKWDGAAWAPSPDSDVDTNTTYTAGTGLVLSGTTFSVGTIPIGNGGTGATTQMGAANAILPVQTSQSGKFLTTDGANVSWASVPSGGITSLTGDVITTGSGAVSSSVTKIQGNAVAPGVPTDGILTWNSTLSRWEAVIPPVCTQAQVLIWSSASDSFSCAAISGIPASNITGLAASATTNTTNADNISSGTLAVARGGTGSATGSITGTGALVFSAGGTNQNVTLNPSGVGGVVLNGKVGVGTSTLSSTLTVNGAIETTSGGVKFPDGTVQTSAASSTGGTIIEPKCQAWNGGCTPPSCPSGWSDLGITNTAYTAANSGGAGGYHSRYCSSTNTYLVIEPKCQAWNGGCTPPSCPSGWSDLGITNTAYTAANSGGAGGYHSRYCVK